MAKIDLAVNTRGTVTALTRNEIKNTLLDFYKKCSSKLPYHIEIFITDTNAAMFEFLREEKFRMSIIDNNDEDSPCYLDTWRGYPRITTSVERLKVLSKLAQQGALRHEAAHSILHGSLEFSIFRIPDECNQVAHIKGIDLQVLDHVVHNVSNAVKDYEATKYMVDREFINCQIAYALEWLKPPMDIDATEKAGHTERQVRFIYQSALLNPILFCHPLLPTPKSKKVPLEPHFRLGQKAEDMLSLLLQHEHDKFIQIVNTIAGNLTSDTHHNVDTALHYAMGLA